MGNASKRDAAHSEKTARQIYESIIQASNILFSTALEFRSSEHHDERRYNKAMKLTEEIHGFASKYMSDHNYFTI